MPGAALLAALLASAAGRASAVDAGPPAEVPGAALAWRGAQAALPDQELQWGLILGSAGAGFVVVAAVAAWAQSRRRPAAESELVRAIEAQRDEVRERVRELERQIQAEAARPDGADLAEDELRLQREAQEVAASLEQRAREEVERASRLADGVAARAGQLQEALSDAAAQAADSVEAFARETCASLAARVQEAAAAAPTEEERLEWEAGALESAGSALRLPLPLLLAGLVSPLQLRGLAAWNGALLALQLPALLALFAAAAVDWGKPCGPGRLRLWTEGMVFLLALAVPLRLRAAVAAPWCAGQLREQPAAAGALFAAGVSGFGEFWASAVASSKGSFATLLAYDRLTRGWSYLLLNSLSMLVFLWGGLGVAFVIHDVVPDEVECPARWIRRAAHSYAFLYVALLIWSLACLAIWVAGFLLSSDAVAMQVLRRAWEFDESFSPAGLPVLTLLVRGLLLRDSKDMATLEAWVLRAEVEEIRLQQKELSGQQDDVNSQLLQAQERVIATGRYCDEDAAEMSAEELAARYSDKLQEAIHGLAVVGSAVSLQLEAHGPSLCSAAQARAASLALQAQGGAASSAAAAVERASGAAAAAAASSLGLGAEELAERARAVGVGDALSQATRLAREAQRRAEAAGAAEACERAGQLAGAARHQGSELGGSTAQAAALAALASAQAAGLDAEELVRRLVEARPPTSEPAEG